jgi:membrane protein implicated in regulation of membrane protease activity
MPTVFWLWLAAAVIFLIIEIGTPVLVFACFTVGSIGAAIVSYFYPDAYLWQAAIFAVVSIILIPLTRPLARKITKPTPQKTNVDAMIGQTGIVVKKIDPDADSGQVRIAGQVWQARADMAIDEGIKIKVQSVSGARLHVTKLDE